MISLWGYYTQSYCWLDCYGVKRRAGTGMGRCQGGFCGPRISELFVEDFGMTVEEVLQDRDGSEMFSGRTKEVR